MAGVPTDSYFYQQSNYAPYVATDSYGSAASSLSEYSYNPYAQMQQTAFVDTTDFTSPFLLYMQINSLTQEITELQKSINFESVESEFQLGEARKRIAAQRKEINTLRHQVGQLKNQIADLKYSGASRKAELNRLKEENDTLLKEISPLAKENESLKLRISRITVDSSNELLKETIQKQAQKIVDLEKKLRDSGV